MSDLPHRLERRILIRARRDVVFQYFTDPARWASWWGAGSSIEARPGGRMLIRHPNGVEASGEVVEVRAPERIVFTYGMATQAAMPPGTTRVTIDLAPHADGTRLTLTHEFADAGVRDEHVQGWRYQLSVFTNVVANAATADPGAVADRWLAVWSTADPETRNAALDALAAPGVRVADRFSAVAGLDEVRAHLAAVHRFMPGMRLERRGEARHCQWTVLADWVALGADGAEKGRGTSVVALDADGRVEAVTSFWA
ncbi:MAG: SRPBCC domain-containing protein [Acidobacteriota bacterium]